MKKKIAVRIELIDFVKAVTIFGDFGAHDPQ